jgi:hypothetical protein
MLDELDELVTQLKQVVADPASGELPELTMEFDRLVNAIGALQDPVAIRALLPFLDDLLDIHPGPLWTLVQAIEHFDADVYISHLLIGLPGLLGWSPSWAESLVARIMNSPQHFAVLASKLPELPKPTRTALRQVLEKLATTPSHAERSRSLLAQVP